MYVLKCVKPGYFNCDHSAGTGEFLTEFCEATRSINRAELFNLKSRANEVKRLYEHGRGKGNAEFEIAKVVISLK